MTFPRGRILRADEAQHFVPIQLPISRADVGRRVDRSVVRAQEAAATLMAEATARAAEIVAEAERRATELPKEGGRAEARLLEQVVELSRLVAERLLGGTLAEAPERVVGIAREVLAEARGARRIHVFASPAGAAVLRAALTELDPDGRVHTVTDDAELSAGDVRLETELGTVEAHLGERVGHLSRKLREVLGS